MNELKGILKIRKINKSSVGFTVPKEISENFDLKVGTFSYKVNKNGDSIILELKNIFPQEEN